MIRIPLLFALLLAPCLGFAQSKSQANAYTDSLLRVLKKPMNDSLRVSNLLLLSDYWSDKDTTKSLGYVRDAAKIAKPGSFSEATVAFYRAGAYFDADIPKSKQFYMQAEQLFRKFKNKESLIYRSRAWHNFGALEQRMDNEKRYTEIIIAHVIPLAQQAGDSARVAANYRNLGVIFSNQLDYRKAQKYLNQSVNILERLDAGSLELADAYVFAAKNYVYLKDYPPIRPLLDSAWQILQHHNDKPHLSDYYLVDGMYYARLQQYETALKSFDKGLAQATRLGRSYDYQSIQLQKYFAFKGMKRYAEALKIIKELLSDDDVFPRNKNRILYYYELAETTALTGDMVNAYKHLHKYAELADSSFMEKTNTEIASLEAKFQSSEKEKQIFQLQSKNERAALTIKNNRLLNWLLAVVCVFLLAVTVLVLLFYRNNKRLWQQQKQLHDLEMQKIKQDYRISMLSAMLEGQEQERTRLARDLHDGLGGLLSSIKIELSQTPVGQNDVIKNSLTRTLSHLDDAVNELRRIARSLMPEILMNYGLAEATKEFCKNLKETGINLVCQVFNYKDVLPKEKQIVLYRIIQELVNNAVKHAAASQILVIIQQSGEILFVTVEDDGKGFDPERTNGKAGAGLSNVKARADFLNAKLELHSTPHNGTSVTVECAV